MSGKLFVCPTPIGNLEDITLRVLRVLREADLIAAEDTRHTRKLLSHFQIHTPLWSYHQYSHPERKEELLRQLREGRRVALVTDAGTPGLSDPGAELIRSALEEGLSVEVLPGPSAVVTALVASGLDTRRFVFEGFLPREGYRKRLELLRLEDRTIVLFEAPHRLLRTLEELARYLGEERRVAVARELTKVHEEIFRGTLSEAREYFKAHPPRGEITLVLEGAAAQTEAAAEEEVLAEVQRLLAEGKTKRAAVKAAARRCGWTARAVYSLVLKRTTSP
ncbi:16S rRNA (cytidine(1402)-2'-O)-methyltransferase [Desulfothermobacter acidiphilus]|uniref:16S rRNA (cytidine(1402)-2'-O)-methyltransferase n=1 Tax=Desulfothermobacter acidiphilus TaxID=1938353 RepID=UPI003F8CBD51